MKLYCFPFAGGNRYSYRPYEKHCPPSLELIPLDLPGHGSRWKEPLLTRVEDMVEDLWDQLNDRLISPYAFYGHSMGSLLSYLLVQRLREEGRSLPLRLFVSGRGGPRLPRKEEDPYTYCLPQKDFIQKLREMGGCPEELLSDANFMKVYEPVLRSDFEAVETFTCDPKLMPLSIPIQVMIGEDERTSLEDARFWQRESSLPVDIKVFSGRHFFIYDHAAAMMNLMAGILLHSNHYSIKKQSSL